MERYLRQLKTGRIYQYTDILSRRTDMVPLDLATAKKRIEANKAMLAEVETAKTPEQIAIRQADVESLAQVASELTETENQIDDLHQQQLQNQPPPPVAVTSVEQAVEQEAQKVIEADEEINQIKGMAKPAKVIKYLKREFGADPISTDDLEALKLQAIQLRTNRLFEG